MQAHQSPDDSSSGDEQHSFMKRQADAPNGLAQRGRKQKCTATDASIRRAVAAAKASAAKAEV